MKTKRQLEIIDTSINLISQKGIQGLTIKNISKEIGISEPAIYRHFENKISILIAILNSFKEMGEMLSSMAQANDDTAINKIEFMFSKILELFIDQPALISVIFSEEIFKNEAILKTKIVEILNLHQINIETIISKGKEDNNVRKDIDTRSLALIVMGSLRLLVKRWELNNYKDDLQLEGDLLIKSLRLIISA